MPRPSSPRPAALLALKRTDEARTAVQAALGSEPSQIEARYLLGTILASRGDLAGATAAFQEVLRINPRAAVAQVQLARIELLRGVPAASAQLAMDALANDPGNPEARLMLARAAIAQRQFARAGTELRALSAKYPSAAEIQHQLGLLERAQGRPDAARRAFERALTLDPAARDSLGELVGLEVAAKRFAAARALVEARIAAAPADSSLQVLAARVSLAEGQPADAERRLRDTIARDPAALDAYGLLAQVYLSQRRLDEARQEFDRLAAQDPQRLGALTMSGMILQVQGRRDEARQRYEQVVQRDRGAAVAANNLAWIYAEGKTNLAAARQLAEAAQIALPNRPEVLDTLGFVYLQQNQPRLALPRARGGGEAGSGQQRLPPSSRAGLSGRRRHRGRAPRAGGVARRRAGFRRRTRDQARARGPAMRTPAVSVVMPAYNVAGYIEAAVGSVLAQDVDLELIVVDDGSTDGTGERLGGIGDPRLRVITQPNSGRPSIARNRGMREARAPILAFLDGDDIYLAGKLRRTLDVFETRADVGFVFHNVWDMDRGRHLRVGLVPDPARLPDAGPAVSGTARRPAPPRVATLLRLRVGLLLAVPDERDRPPAPAARWRARVVP